MKIKSILRLLVGISILSVIIYKINLIKIITILKTTNPLFISLSIFLFLVSTLFACLPLLSLLPNVNKKNFLKPYLISRAYSSILPGKIGDFSIILLAKDNIPIGKTTSALIINKIITLAIMLALFTITTIIYAKELLILILLPIVLLLSLIVLIKSKIVKNLFKKILKNWLDYFKGFGDHTQSITKIKTILANSVLTILLIIITVVLYKTIFLALNTNVPISLIIFYVAAATIASIVPITVSGLGINEAVALFVYSLINISPEIIITSSLIYLILKYMFSAIVIGLTHFRQNG